MEFVGIRKEADIATVVLSHGKVNALSETVVEQLHSRFAELENDTSVKAVVLTGEGKFFSFGFDIAKLLSYTKSDFVRFLEKFTAFHSYLFLYPKPVIGALNGHATAGGCVLAIGCDYRIMVSGRARISLNEITFGSSVFASITHILKHCVGARNAEEILFSGDMYSAEQALKLGLIDMAVSDEDFPGCVAAAAAKFAERSGPAFTHMKSMFRQPVAEMYAKTEAASIKTMADIWYSDETLSRVRKIEIRG
jgi:Delta3-Delta2-enoyl-CoA isomerase